MGYVTAFLTGASFGAFLGHYLAERVWKPYTIKSQEFADFWQKEFCKLLERLPAATREETTR